MKTLYIVRHGKALLRTSDEVEDFERPLIEKGIQRTRRMVEFLNRNSENADLIITSPAIRAIETAKIIVNGTGYPHILIQVERGLYTENESFIFDLLSQTSIDVNGLMIVGHNPTLTNFLNYWLKTPIDWLKTSSVACLTFDTNEWTEITRVSNQLKFIYPQK